MSTTKNEHNPDDDLCRCRELGDPECPVHGDTGKGFRFITPPADTTGSGREGETAEVDSMVYYAVADPAHIKRPELNKQQPVVLADDARQLAIRLAQQTAQLEQYKFGMNLYISALGEVAKLVGSDMEKSEPQDVIEDLRSKLAQVEALRRDGERLDWLSDWFESKGSVELESNEAGVDRFDRNGHTLHIFDSDADLRAAIDSAQRQEGR